MKKSLLVFCFVTMALGVFAEGDNVEDVEVTAQVVPKLDITTEAVEFGTVVANTDNNKPEKLGKIIIKGTGHEQKMKIKFADASGSNWTENPNDLKIQLVNKEHSENKLTYTWFCCGFIIKMLMQLNKLLSVIHSGSCNEMMC